ncbi:MAG: O-antigen ligase family protein [Acidobacteriota bacterium]
MARKSGRRGRRRAAKRAAPKQSRAAWTARLGELCWRAAPWCVVLLWILTAVVVAPGIREAFPLPKMLVAQALGLVSVLLICLSAGLDGHRASLLLERTRTTRWAAVGIGLVALLSALLTGMRAHSVDAVEPLLVGLLCLALWSCLDGRRLLDWLLAPAALLAVIGLLQATGLYSPFGLESSGAERLRLTSLAGSVGDLGAYLVLPLLLSQARIASCARGSRGWWLGIASALLIGAALLATQTLVALVAAVLGFTVFWLLLLDRRRGLAGLSLAVGAAAAATLALAPLRSRVLAKWSQIAEGELNAALSGRLDGWRVAVEQLRSMPLSGVGHGAYVARFNEAKLDLLDRDVEFFSQHRLLSTFGNAHNELLEVSAEWGLLGVLVVLASVAWLFRSALGHPAGSVPRALALGGTVAVLMLCLGYFPLRLALTGFPLCLFAAWLLSDGGEAESMAGGEETAAGETPRWPWIVVSVLVLFALVVTTQRSLDRLAAGRILFTTEARAARIAAEPRSENSRRLLGNGLRILQQARELDPAEVRIPMAMAGHYLLLGNEESAIRFYEVSLALEPRPETYFNLGLAQLQSGDRSAAEEAFARAVALDPSRRRDLPSPGLLP